MLDIPQSTIARAIEILRAGPMRADEFARRMWPERSADRTTAQQSRSGHALLRQLALVGYVAKVGDLWMLRTVGTGEALRDFPVPTADATFETAVRLPAEGLAPADPLPVGAPPGWDRPAMLQRLHRLVALATEPVPTVTHDAVLGDIEIRGFPLDDLLMEACAWVTLRGRSANIYSPGETSEALVALTPIEAARALYLRWQQSGQPPALLNEEAWIFADDGLIAPPDSWKPEGVDDEEWLCEHEPLDKQVYRQREAAGLA